MCTSINLLVGVSVIMLDLVITIYPNLYKRLRDVSRKMWRVRRDTITSIVPLSGSKQRAVVVKDDLDATPVLPLEPVKGPKKDPMGPSIDSANEIASSEL